MTRLIDAERLKAGFFNAYIDEHFKPTKLLSWNNITDIINNAPTVEERPTGKWIKITKEGTVPAEYICSVCGRKIYDNYGLVIPQSEFYPFCHCGADMRGDEV